MVFSVVSFIPSCILFLSLLLLLSAQNLFLIYFEAINKLVIDKFICWMLKDRRSKDYANGVESFIAFSLQHSIYKNCIKCPCVKHGNMISHNEQKIRKHMFFYGIDQSYHQWYWHGDPAPSGLSTSRAEHHNRFPFSNVDSIIEMVQDVHNDCQNNPKTFETLLEDAKKPLYSRCTNFTNLFALVKLYNLKARYGRSDKIYFGAFKNSWRYIHYKKEAN